jgi:hypothetical protein
VVEALRPPRREEPLRVAHRHEEAQLLLLPVVAVVDQPIRMAHPCIGITR